MGQDEERERRLHDLGGYRIDDDLLALASERAIVMHCLPGPLRRGDHRGRPARAALGRVGPGGEPPARAEGAHGARDPLARAGSVLPLKDNVPTRHFPVVTVALIAANVLVWLLYQDAGTEPGLDGFDRRVGYHPCEVDGLVPDRRRGLAR